jgi:hypothetical protein
VGHPDGPIATALQTLDHEHRQTDLNVGTAHPIWFLHNWCWLRVPAVERAGAASLLGRHPARLPVRKQGADAVRHAVGLVHVHPIKDLRQYHVVNLTGVVLEDAVIRGAIAIQSLSLVAEVV